MNKRCRALLKDGAQCARNADNGFDVCWLHFNAQPHGVLKAQPETKLRLPHDKTKEIKEIKIEEPSIIKIRVYFLLSFTFIAFLYAVGWVFDAAFFLAEQIAYNKHFKSSADSFVWVIPFVGTMVTPILIWTLIIGGHIVRYKDVIEDDPRVHAAFVAAFFGAVVGTIAHIVRVTYV